MNGIFSVLVLVIYLTTNCSCGLVNSKFNEGNIEPDAHLTKTKCREKREIDENRIKSDIRQPSASDKVISLIDVESELPTEGEQESGIGARPNLKTKRCHSKTSLRYTHKPRLLHHLHGPLLLAKRNSKWDNTNLKNCSNCRHKKRCKTSDKCTNCQEVCQYNTDDPGIVSLSNRISPGDKDNIFSKTLYPISTYKEGEVKNIICKLVGLYDRSDIETVTVWVTTYSNNPPKLMEGVISDQSIEENSTDQNLKASENQPDLNQKSANLQSRFGEYDDLDDGLLSEDEEVNLKKNPDIIEGPPPLVGSENNAERNEETSKAVDSSKKLIVQPKEFEDDEADEDYENTEYVDSIERANEPVTADPEPKLADIEPSIQSRVQDKADQINKMFVKDDEMSIAHITTIMKAIDDLKSMVKEIQADTATNPKLLGLPSPNSPPNQLHPPVPDHVVDNLKKVNQYLKNRAQDVLDVIQNENDQLKQPPPVNPTLLKDEHSDITKNIITNLKKMPQFVLDRFQDSLNKIEDDVTQLQRTNLAPVKADSDGGLVDIKQRFGDRDDADNDDNDNDNYKLGIPNSATDTTASVNVEITTLSSPKKKLGQYLSDIKDKKRIYTPKKHPALGKTKGTTLSDLITPKNGDKTENSPRTSLTNLKNKAKMHSFLEDAIIDPRNIEIATESIESSTKNIDGMVGSRVDNILPNINDKHSHKTLLQSVTAPSKQHFKLPTIPTVSNINEATNPTRLQKYIDKIKMKHPQKTFDESTPSTVKIEPEELTQLAQRNNFNRDDDTPETTEPDNNVRKSKQNKHLITGALTSRPLTLHPISTAPRNQEHPDTESGKTYQSYLDKLKTKISPLEKYKLASKPFEPKKYNLSSRLGDANENYDDKKHILKNKLDDFVAKLKKPLNRNVPTIRSRLNPTTKRILPIKSVEKQKSELNSMVNNLKHLISDKLPKNSEPTVYEIVNGELPNKLQSTALPTDDIIKAPEPDNLIEDQNDNEVSQLEPTLESRSNFIDETNDWSDSLGKIVSNSSNPNEVYFIGNGIKLPMKVHRKADKTLDLTVDIDKLCSCKNSTCSKNSAVIEKTVGEILEKEAEIENQLNGNSDLISKSFDLTSNALTDSPNRKSELSKRSPDIEDLPKNQLTKIPMLSNLKDVLTDITNLGNQLKDSLSSTVDEMKNNVDKIKKIKTNNEIYKSIPTVSSLTGTVDNRVEELNNYLEEINSDILKKIDYNKDLNNFIKDAKSQKVPILSNIKSPLINRQSNILGENINSINNNLKHSHDIFQLAHVNSLKNKLNELDSAVDKFKDNNENLFVKSTEKLLGNSKNNIIDKEVNFIKKMLLWMKDLTSGTEK